MWLRSAFVFVVISVAAQGSRAAELWFSATVADVLRADWTPFPEGTAPGITTTHGIPLVAKLDLFLQIDRLRPEEGEAGFGDLVFDVWRYGDVDHIVLPVWLPDSSTVDINGSDIGGTVLKWGWTGDLGPSGTDLKSVLVGNRPQMFGAEGVDPRRTLGQHGPEYFGSLFIPWDGETVFQVYVNPDGFATYSPELLFNSGASSDGRGVAVEFGNPTLTYSVLDWNVYEWDPWSTAQEFVVNDDHIGITIWPDARASYWKPGSYSFNEKRLSVKADVSEDFESGVTSFDFATPVTDVNFTIAGIGESPEGFIDEVTVVGLLGGEEVLPQLTGDGVRIIDEDTVAAAIGAEDCNFLCGSVDVAFEEPIDRILVTFRNELGVVAAPSWEGFSVSDIRFSTVEPSGVPEPSGIGLLGIGIIWGLTAQTRRRKSRRSCANQ